MKNILTAGGSKKLMLSGAGMAILIEAAYSMGWTWYFALGIAFIAGCYCIGQAMVDAKDKTVKSGEKS